MSEPKRRWIYRADLVRVIDGDTVVMMIHTSVDPGFRMATELSFPKTLRLQGIDTPERTGRTKVMGEAARLFVEHILGRALQLEVETLGEVDKYGDRWQAVIKIMGDPPDLWINVNEYLVLLGYAQAYDGTGPRPTWNIDAPYPLRPVGGPRPRS